jgi:nitrogen fixation protein NifU and related proteins
MNLPYNKKVMKLFMNPKNMGEIKNADGVGKVGNPTCGDIMWVYIKVGKNKSKKGKEIIKDIKFKTFGCAAAIATSSMITQVAKGKTLEEAKKIKYQDIVKSLGGLPSIKIHCSCLATEALNKSIDNYNKKKSKSKEEEK